MPDYRASFIFEAGRVGWSEQWYISAVSAASAISRLTQSAFLTGFLFPRAIGVYLVALRVNNVDAPRDTRLQILNINAGAVNGATGTQGEEPNVCALGYLNTDGGNKRPVMVRGLIDTQVNRDDSDNVVWSGALTKALNQFAAAVMSVPLKVRVLQPANGANPDRQLVQMAPPANDAGSTRFTFNDPVGLLGGVPIIIHGLPRSLYPGYGGPLPAYNQTPTNFDVPVAWRQPAVVVALRQATARNAIYVLEAASAIAWEDLRTKRCGRPSFAPRGRRAGIKYRSH